MGRNRFQGAETAFMHNPGAFIDGLVSEVTRRSISKARLVAVPLGVIVGIGMDYSLISPLFDGPSTSDELTRYAIDVFLMYFTSRFAYESLTTTFRNRELQNIEQDLGEVLRFSTEGKIPVYAECTDVESL